MENSVEEFERALEPITAAAGRDAIAQSWMVEVAANRPPWTPSGIELSTGDQISIFSAGRASIADQPNVWVGSHFSLWMRIGPQGEIFRAPGRSYTFTVGAGGQLYLSSLFPGDWADRHGALATNPRAYERVAGTLAVLVMRWRIDPRAGLDRLAHYGSAGAAIVHAQAERLKNPATTPAGWHYLWSIGDSGIFDSGQSAAGEPIIRCRMRDDAAILQRPVQLKFDSAVKLRWAWKIDALPTARPEDAVASHDYLSVAVEFDNGQDLTYLWSAAMAPESSFRCRHSAMARARDPSGHAIGDGTARTMGQRRTQRMGRLWAGDRNSSCGYRRGMANRGKHLRTHRRVLRVFGAGTGYGWSRDTANLSPLETARAATFPVSRVWSVESDCANR